jgi:hypothetical protein
MPISFPRNFLVSGLKGDLLYQADKPPLCLSSPNCVFLHPFFYQKNPLTSRKKPRWTLIDFASNP